MKIAVLGSGTWGVALARVLALNGANVTVWSKFPEEAEKLRETREAPNLPGVYIPEEIIFTANPAEASAGADLVLCGHTHGGQFIPINHVGEWIGENCLRYGHEKRGDTDFIVSSGISIWTFRFKTGCKSEIVVIDLVPAAA